MNRTFPFGLEKSQSLLHNILLFSTWHWYQNNFGNHMEQVLLKLLLLDRMISEWMFSLIHVSRVNNSLVRLSICSTVSRPPGNLLLEEGCSLHQGKRILSLKRWKRLLETKLGVIRFQFNRQDTIRRIQYALAGWGWNGLIFDSFHSNFYSIYSMLLLVVTGVTPRPIIILPSCLSSRVFPCNFQ